MYKKTYQERIKESTYLLEKYPNRVPIIIIPGKNITEKKEFKFLVPENLSLIQLVYLMKEKMNHTSYDSIYFCIDNIILNSTEKIYNLKRKYKSKDGFLYIYYVKENTFG